MLLYSFIIKNFENINSETMPDYNKKNLKQKLLKNEEMIDDQGRQLNDIEKNMKETENIGIAIQGNLKDQRGKLEKANEDVIKCIKLLEILIFQKVKDTHHTLKKTDKLAREINRRYLCFKGLLFGTIVFLLIAIIAVLGIKLGKK